MADETIVPVEVDTGDSAKRLDDVAEASERAGEALDKLDGGNLDKIDAAASDAVAALDRVEAATDIPPAVVRIDVDADSARRAAESLEDIDRKGRDMADGVGFGNNALRDLTGPLGDVTGNAGDVGDAFEGLGDIVGGIGAKFGLGEDAVKSLKGGVAGLGVVVAIGVAAWSAYQKSQEKAKKAAEDLKAAQDALAEGKLDDAAASLTEQYKGTIKALQDAGYNVDQFLQTLRGSGTVIQELEARYDYLGEAMRQSGLTVEEIDKMFGEFLGLGDLIENLKAARDGWGENTANADAYGAVLPAVRAALGKVGTEAEETSGKVAGITTEFGKLTKALDQQSAIEDVRDAFDDVYDAAVEAWSAGATGAEDADRKARDYEQSIRDAIAAVLGLTDELENVPDETIAEIAVQVQQGDLDEARRLLDGVADGLPPVQLKLDDAYLSSQFQAWLRSQGPGSNSMSPTAPPSTLPPSDAGIVGRMREGYVNVTNYYPPYVDPFAVTQAETEYTRVQVGP